MNVFGFDGAQQFLKLGHIEMIVQALAKRLGNERKLGLAPGDLQQVAAAQPLQPERRPFSRRRARQQQSTGGILAKPQGEQGAVRQLAENEALDILDRNALEQVKNTRR